MIQAGKPFSTGITKAQKKKLLNWNDSSMQKRI